MLFRFQGPARLAQKFPADERQIGVTEEPMRCCSQQTFTARTTVWTGVPFYATPDCLAGDLALQGSM